MLIGKVSEKTGFSRDTIRYYEKLGLIQSDNQGRFNHYRYYSEAVIKRLLTIKKIKDFGFTLQETQNLLVLFEASVLDHERGKKYLRKKLEGIDAKIKELESIKKKLESVILESSSPDNCAIGVILNEMK